MKPPSPFSSISTHQTLPFNLHAKISSVYSVTSLVTTINSISLPKMKSLKQVMSLVVAIAKAKTMAMRSKTNAIKTRLTLFKLLHEKKVLTSVFLQKVHAVKVDDKSKDYNKAVVAYKSTHTELVKYVDEEEEAEDYPYTTESIQELEEEDDELERGTISVTDFISSLGDGSDSSLKNEIDKAADLFIRRFHRQIKFQKQESFKRYQEMLERST